MSVGGSLAATLQGHQVNQSMSADKMILPVLPRSLSFAYLLLSFHFYYIFITIVSRIVGRWFDFFLRFMFVSYPFPCNFDFDSSARYLFIAYRQRYHCHWTIVARRRSSIYMSAKMVLTMTTVWWWCWDSSTMIAIVRSAIWFHQDNVRRVLVRFMTQVATNCGDDIYISLRCNIVQWLALSLTQFCGNTWRHNEVECGN